MHCDYVRMAALFLSIALQVILMRPPSMWEICVLMCAAHKQRGRSHTQPWQAQHHRKLLHEGNRILQACCRGRPQEVEWPHANLLGLLRPCGWCHPFQMKTLWSCQPFQLWCCLATCPILLWTRRSWSELAHKPCLHAYFQTTKESVSTCTFVEKQGKD